MCGPRSVATDGQRLIVAETFGNSRVMIWNQIPLENGPSPADVVLGQVDFTSNAFISQAGLQSGGTLSFDGTRLFVYSGPDRILIHNTLPEENNRPADVVLGQPDFTTAMNPPLEHEYRENMGEEWYWRRVVSYGGILSDGERLFVSDGARNRVLIWNSIPTTNFAPADVVLGQPNFTAPREPGAGRSGLNFPGDITSDGKRLIVADCGNARVLIWNTIPTENGQPADVVVGQPDFDSTEPRSGRTGFSEPDGVATDGKRLFVSDHDQRRVLIWNSIPTQNGQPADVVLGWPSFELIPDEGPFPELDPAVKMGPIGVFSDGIHLFVADTGHQRMMIWNSIPTQNAQPADVVLGQPNFESLLEASTNRDRLFMPEYVVFDGQHLWVGETKFGDRVVRFSIPKPKASILRSLTDVTTSSMRLEWSPGTLEGFARYEVHKSTEPGFTPSGDTLVAEITDPVTTSYTASGLSLNTTYWFKIRTYYADGSYGDSVQRWATTLSAPEVVPEEKINWPLYVGIGAAIAILAGVLFVLKRR